MFVVPLRISKTLLGHNAILIGHIGGSSGTGIFALHDLGLNCIRPGAEFCQTCDSTCQTPSVKLRAVAEKSHRFGIE